MIYDTVATSSNINIYAATGRLGLLDYDEVELSNLHRQVLHGEDTQGKPKSLSAAQAVGRWAARNVPLPPLGGTVDLNCS